MADKSKLKDMIQDLINDRQSQAEIPAHEFIVQKFRELHGSSSDSVTEPDNQETMDLVDPD